MWKFCIVNDPSKFLSNLLQLKLHSGWLTVLQLAVLQLTEALHAPTAAGAVFQVRR
jgi:hypothetical protein